jgi:hypothetical protein
MVVPNPRKYRVRYKVQLWNKPVVSETRQGPPGVKVSKDDYGYTDEILVVSILKDGEGKTTSMAFFDSVSCNGQPPREMMEEIRDQIDHYLEHHCK